jgi:hypothetical protein
VSYTYLQEQGEESSAECFSDIPASVLSRLNLTAAKCCSNDSETDTSQSSRSGMTLRRSMGGRGPGSLMWYAGDSLVRTYLPPAKEWESAVSDLDYGPNSPGSLAKFNPALYGWKTRQCSLFGGLEWFSETWPRWGLMRDGELFPLPTPVHLTLGREFGYSPAEWDTPSCADAHPRALNRAGPYLGGAMPPPSPSLQQSNVPNAVPARKRRQPRKSQVETDAVPNPAK